MPTNTPLSAAHDALSAELSEIGIALARQAGELMQRHRLAGLTVSSKSSSTDLVTDADRAVEAHIVAELKRVRPSDVILGEESAESSASAVTDGDARSAAISSQGVLTVKRPVGDLVRWVVDPIDGTVNFLLGQPQYAVSIATQLGGITVAGCVLNPVSGDLFRARLGHGAFCNDVPLHGPRDVALAEAIVATGFSYRRQRRAEQGRVIAEILPRVGNLRRAGSAALDLCSTAAGWVDLYFETGTHEWDHAAGLLIAQEAGVVTSGLRGRRAGFWMVAAAHPNNAEDFFALLSSLDADEAEPSERPG